MSGLKSQRVQHVLNGLQVWISSDPTRRHCLPNPPSLVITARAKGVGILPTLVALCWGELEDDGDDVVAIASGCGCSDLEVNDNLVSRTADHVVSDLIEGNARASSLIEKGGRLTAMKASRTELEINLDGVDGLDLYSERLGGSSGGHGRR